MRKLEAESGCSGHAIMIRLFILFLVALLWVQCTIRHGRDEVVDLASVTNTNDEIFVAYLREQIRQRPHEETNYVKLAAIYKQKGRINDALTVLLSANRGISDNKSILIPLGYLYLEEKKLEELSAILKTLRTIDPEGIDLLKLSAGYALLLKDHENAMFFANRAMLQNPYDDFNHHLVGQAFLQKYDTINCLKHYEQAFDKRSSYFNFSALYNLLLSQKNIKSARTLLEKFEVLSNDLPLCYEWGSYFNVADMRDSAGIVLKNCMHLFPEDYRLNMALSRFYAKTNKDSALYFIDEYLQYNPSYLDAHLQRARLLGETGNMSEAIVAYQQILDTDSTFSIAATEMDILIRKVAYLRLVKRKEDVQKTLDVLKPLGTKNIN